MNWRSRTRPVSFPRTTLRNPLNLALFGLKEHLYEAHTSEEITRSRREVSGRNGLSLASAENPVKVAISQ